MSTFDFKKPKFEPVPKGIYIVKLDAEPELKESGFYKDKEGNPQQYLSYFFTIITDEDGNPEHEEQKLFFKCSPRSGRNMDIYNAINNTSEEEAAGDWSELIDKPLRVNVIQEKDNDGNMRNKIDAFMPVKGDYKAPEAKKAPEAEKDEINIDDIPF